MTSNETTIMVSFVNISAYDAQPPESEGRKKINGGPLYLLDDVKEKSGKVKLITRKCTKDVQNLGFGEEGVSQLLNQLVKTDYLNSEWCQCGDAGTHYAACDAYRVCQYEYNEAKCKNEQHEYYLKFALKKNGDLVLIVSCHI